MGWWIALGILVLLAILPLGVSVRYDSQGVLVKIICGFIRLRLFPMKRKPKKEEKPKAPEIEEAPPPEPEPAAQTPPPAREIKQIGKAQPDQTAKPGQAREKGGSLLDFLPLVKIAISFLADFRRKLRLDKLELKLILAGDDPCDLAVNYGRAWAAIGNLMPKLEKWFVMKDRDIEVECDFTASEMLVIARLDLTITLGRLLAAVFRFVFRAAVQYVKILIKRKGGAKK